MLTLLASSVARARCSALLTDATLVSSSSATSAAFQRRTSQRIRTARWRGGRCCSAATNARRIVSRAAATSAGSPSDGTASSSGIGSIHVTSGSVAAERAVGIARGPEVHRPGAALAPVEHVEADVRRDAVEPRAQRCASLEAIDAAPGADHRVLNRVLGLERRAEHPVAMGGQLGPVLLELELECGRCADRRSLHDVHRRQSGHRPSRDGRGLARHLLSKDGPGDENSSQRWVRLAPGVAAG